MKIKKYILNLDSGKSFKFFDDFFEDIYKNKKEYGKGMPKMGILTIKNETNISLVNKPFPNAYYLTYLSYIDFEEHYNVDKSIDKMCLGYELNQMYFGKDE